ncbi:flagellar basal body protein [Marinococcus halophilus]|uniref:flagellar basal body protein n=1 Tax=Marinococcus halophilus TaxID=1371 RepID=UPI0036211AE5
MYSGLRIPFQSMGAVQQQMDTISNNLSNAETAGFKSRQATFSEMMYQQEDNMPMPENGTGRLTPPGSGQAGGQQSDRPRFAWSRGR